MSIIDWHISLIDNLWFFTLNHHLPIILNLTRKQVCKNHWKKVDPFITLTFLQRVFLVLWPWKCLHCSINFTSFSVQQSWINLLKLRIRRPREWFWQLLPSKVGSPIGRSRFWSHCQNLIQPSHNPGSNEQQFVDKKKSTEKEILRIDFCVTSSKAM